MNIFRKPLLCLCVLSQMNLAACASRPENISASYVSPLQYQSFSCNQVQMEMGRVSRRVNEVTGIQDSQATKDSVALGVGLILFWPSLFFMIGKDKEEELSRLKGEYEALEQTAIQKECNVTKEIEAARKMEQERLEAKKQQEKEVGKMNE